MENIAVIDIGSNTMRLVLAHINEEGYLKIYDELKESVRLGQGMSKDGKLNPDRVEHALEALKLFKDMCDASNTSNIIATATAAVRAASDGDSFIRRVKEDIGIHIRILSGDQEAYYDYFSSINSIDIEDCMIIDIGGSSAELIYVEGRRLVNATSLPMGAISLSNDFNLGDSISKEDKASLNKFITKSFKELKWLENGKKLPLIAIGGSSRNIGKIHKKSNNYPLDISHMYSMDREDLSLIYDRIMDADLKARRKMKGLSKDRADIIPGAVAVIDRLMEYLDLEELIISGRGIREGLLYDYLLKDTVVPDVLEYSLHTMLTNHNQHPSHGESIWEISRKLFDDLSEVHKIKPINNGVDIYKVLKAAAYLHDVGISTSYYDHHKHSFYMVVNTNLNGLTQKELLMAAYALSLHRKDEVRVQKAHYKSVIDDEDSDVIKKLGLLLRIAEQLDRRSNGNILEVSATIDDNLAILKVIGREDPSLEIKNTMVVAPKFKSLFGKRLIIV